MARIFFTLGNKNKKFNIKTVKNFIINGLSRKINYKIIHDTGIYNYFFASDVINKNNFLDNNNFLCFIDGTPHIDNRQFDTQDFISSVKNNQLKKTLHSINGGFVGLIYDKKRKVLYTFRDRFGLKPLYIYNKYNNLVISSSINYINKSTISTNELNYDYLYRYAFSNYKSIYGREETIFKNIKMQKISSYYIFKNNELKKMKYWDLKPYQSYSNKPIKKLQEELIDIFDNMMKNYLINNKNKKSAVALSGGMDSGLISGLINKNFEKPNAVSLTYKEKSKFNEEPLIRESVKKNINKWTNFKLSATDLLEDLSNDFYKNFDAPLATISIYGYDYLFKKAAQKGYELLYTGSGGDYIQSGNYTNYWYYLADLFYEKKPIFNKELNYWIKNHSTDEYPKSKNIFNDEIIKKVDLSNFGKLKSQNLLFDPKIINKNKIHNTTKLKSKVVQNYGSYLRSFMMQEYIYDAVAPGVEAEDLMEWQNNISLNSPFFDKEVAEFGWKLKSNLKILNGQNKYLYRKTFNNILPSKIVNRVSKSGFNAPFDLWSRNELKDFILDIYNSNSFKQREIYNYKNFMQLINQHMSSDSNQMMLVWQSINLELWLRSKNL